MTQRIRFHDHSPEGAQALRAVHDYVDHCGLPKALIDLVYLRTSQINGCAYCVDMHTRDLLQDGMAADKITLLPVWQESAEVFTARECAALRWAESLAYLPQTHAADADYEAAAAEFSEKELSDLTIAIALMNAYNRLGVGFRMPPRALTKLREKRGKTA